jgi:hypothetical protein
MQLIQVLQVPLDQARQDLESAMKKRHMFDLLAQGQVQYLWKTPQFRSWFFSDSSAVLLVDANFDSSLSGRISPMSLFCSMLAFQLPDQDRKIWLQFFCGQYTRRGGALTVYGPHGMLRSILTQLLLNLYQRDMVTLAFPDATALAHQGGPPSINGLCRMLADLMRCIPGGMTVFCAIDGISYFEVEEMASELCGVVDFLHDMASDASLHSRFKLLLTCGTRSKFVCDRLDQVSQRVTLQRGQGKRGINPRTFMSEANKAMMGHGN